MPTDFSFLPNLLRVLLRISAPVTIFTGFLLFAPEQWINGIGLESLRHQYKPYLGATFCFFAAVTLWNLIRACAVRTRKRGRENQTRELYISYFKTLTVEEKELLRRYLENQTKTVFLPLYDGVASGLCRAKIIYRASTLGVPGSHFNFAHNIQPWAWDYLNQHPDFVGLPLGWKPEKKVQNPPE